MTNARFKGLKQHTSSLMASEKDISSSSKTLKLQKFLADSGLCSRRKGESLISEGLVSVNGETAEIGFRIDPSSDVIKFNGKRIQAHRVAPLTLMVNKPRGFTCSNEDEYAERLIFELLESRHSKHRLFCAGRLDMESEGLVILTNDGNLAHRLTHPSGQVKKKYQVELNSPLKTEHLPLLIKGFEQEGEFLRLDEVRSKGGSAIGVRKLEVIMGHGKKREIRRAFSHFRYKVKKLRRISIGGLYLDGLPLGNYRELMKKEIDLLLPR